MSSSSTSKNSSPKSQIDKFREAASEVETDDREETFDRALKAVAKPLPKDQKPKKKR